MVSTAGIGRPISGKLISRGGWRWAVRFFAVFFGMSSSPAPASPAPAFEESASSSSRTRDSIERSLCRSTPAPVSFGSPCGYVSGMSRGGRAGVKPAVNTGRVGTGWNRGRGGFNVWPDWPWPWPWAAGKCNVQLGTPHTSQPPGSMSQWIGPQPTSGTAKQQTTNTIIQRRFKAQQSRITVHTPVFPWNPFNSIAAKNKENGTVRVEYRLLATGIFGVIAKIAVFPPN